MVWDSKEVHRRDGLSMIAQKSEPTLAVAGDVQNHGPAFESGREKPHFCGKRGPPAWSRRLFFPLNHRSAKGRPRQPNPSPWTGWFKSHPLRHPFLFTFRLRQKRSLGLPFSLLCTTLVTFGWIELCEDLAPRLQRLPGHSLRFSRCDCRGFLMTLQILC
jgi:hypothetical protein